jgi:hypothetical protein
MIKKKNINHFIVFIKTGEPLFTEIIFVMHDNRAICGKLYITNFRVYFKSDVRLFCLIYIYIYMYIYNLLNNIIKNLLFVITRNFIKIIIISHILL